MDNAFLRLREQCLAVSTRAFHARGSAMKRCQRCLMSVDFCICAHLTCVSSAVDLVLLLHRDEVFKPTNTGRLIADVLPHNTYAFVWSRTQPCAGLLDILKAPTRACVLAFPSNSESPRAQWRLGEPLCADKRLTIILPDGSWRQASRMVRLSPYLQRVPSVQVTAPTAEYSVRKAPAEGQLSTAEATVALLRASSQLSAAQALSDYFQVFNERYPLSRGRHSASLLPE